MNSIGFAQYAGGTGDGFNVDAACTTDLNGTSTSLTIGSISGSTQFCDNGSETYSVSVSSGTADSYHWTGPSGSIISAQQIEGYASILFGNTSGNITVEVSNACATTSTNLAVSNSACQQFFGGNNDGHDHDASCSTTLDGVGTGLTIGSISGSSTFCDNSSETYSINITAGSADNFLWTGPTGTTIASQQIDGYANLLFGNTSGNVTVEVSNACATTSTNLPVSNSTCQQFFGGNNDGHDHDASCSTTLDGVGTGLTIGSISGPSTFCVNSSETYSINITAGSADNFLWTGPTGTTIASQQIDGYANLFFGNTPGNVTVEVSNACATASANLVVSNSTCQEYFGGIGDGFVLGTSAMSIPLPVELIYFQASLDNRFVKLNWATASEINNDYYEVQRSKDLSIWESISRIQGAGNSRNYLEYETHDKSPYLGFSYYRLKQIDFDGSDTYSDRISINRYGQSLNVYPNPAQNEIFIHLKTSQPTVFSLTSLSGTVVLQTEETTAQYITIDVSKLNSGIYFLHIQNPSNSEIRKVEIIQ
ncbi:T9SS type A sorting domain-containing protein [Reichenbachiella sp.]|uniref:T9SS type A sorting domain-containing protein n=1 Tax=Reichenbachiella sp. TaxID=2184521 RepID=UPI003298A203